ncbi:MULTISPECIES: BPTD_3080 family restriction endonuclease [Rhizobium]|uniref:BPTD_3080 family restriction endonuclease n=1 Tax=Rhizobium TaxID=379 RepID=UPI00103132DD|nr:MULTISPECIES: DEAD/DEAH box helicase family protein [Rhizobium]NEI28466.1 hydrolase [Rhizobium ruizarguesonis]NKL64990.1 hydrolase [Rhizobium leguminosarum bv. viciae]TBA81184.1 hydrolase [Rhizobium ruizarguesonis]TBZ64518.1 hydrolase [Rhizobium leguminosarum bv. viciae]
MPATQEKPPLTVAEVDSPIINSPFQEPVSHWLIERGKPPTKTEGRRRASYFYRVPEHAGRGQRSKQQTELFESEKGEEIELEIVNFIRERVKEWRSGSRSGGVVYDGASPVTKELLELWRSNDRMQRLFFAQIEAVETIIFLVEAKDIYHKGLPEMPKDEPGLEAKTAGVRAFARYACKMATGSGKTTVMGMLTAWSILNRVASPRDDRFSDTVLIVCPNVTIRERLQELDPALGDLSLYRTRQLVPPHRMEELRRGEVMIANWHRLAKKETNIVNRVSAKVVKTGVPVEVVRNAGRENEIKYFESDAAWFKRIRRELGSGKGRSQHWLIFNDEAHHAYRRGDVGAEDQALDEDKELAKKNEREATIWIEGLDRINRLAGGSRRRGINLCVDLSATPFYIQGSGNEVGKPFPWIVSDFGLLDAIESGLVKIPQLPARDVTGAAEAAYFNIWRWVQAKAKEDGYGTNVTPELVMNYASAPINLLAAEWHERFLEWEQFSKQQHKHPVPPVFIVVCRDTAIAKEVHSWLANGNDGYGVSPLWFRNAPGHEVTVRIDSKVIEDIEEGGSKDETRRLRFILDTVGKPEWPGGKVPEEWSELVRKHNDKAASDDNDGSLKWIDERIPPGRDVRCIVSVAMLAEGWDANTVTHIVGLRPFGSQLLCEQVVGRALRRKSYALNEETQMFAEETAKVFGVPFELIPFKVAPAGQTLPQPEPNHIYSVPEKAEYEITFPLVTGYHQSGQFDVFVDWDRVSKVTIDPMRIPQIVELTPLTTPDGTLAAYGPGDKPVLSLKDWRAMFREQQVAFRLAREICLRWQADNGAAAVPTQHLFPKIAFAAKRFLAEKLDLKGDSETCDVLLVGEYMQAAIGSLLEAIKKGSSTTEAEIAVVPQGAAGSGSTLFVDFHTTKPIYPATRCHLNAMVADTQKWEQSAAFLLDSHPGVKKWVKNDRLGFFIPYRNRGIPAKYVPDFIVVTDTDQNVVIEIKGQMTDGADAKARAAQRWVYAVNRLGQYGLWHYLLVSDPGRLGLVINDFTGASWK